MTAERVARGPRARNDGTMRLLIVCGMLALVACRGKGRAREAGPTPRTEDERALYALGVMLGERIGNFNLSPRELEVVQRGIHDAVTGAKPVVNVEQYQPRLRELAMSRQQARSRAERQRGQQYIERAAQEPGARRLPSGLVIKQLSPGTGQQPTANDTVTVNYRGMLINGTEFDSSYRRGQPATFPLQGVIPCWTQGLQEMRVGERARLVCPPELAYGDRSPGEIPPGATLVFEVELLGVQPRTQAPPAAALQSGEPTTTQQGTQRGAVQREEPSSTRRGGGPGQR